MAAPIRGTGAGMVRGRLLDLLDRSESTGLGLVIAPQGYGKTTLLAQWARSGSTPAVWVGGADWETLSRYCDAAEPPLRIVVDDVHRLDRKHAHDLIRGVERATAAGSVVMLAGRQMPHVNLARAEVPQPVIVGRADLQFRPWEVDLLDRSLNSRRSAGIDAALNLVSRTDGWPAAVYLLLLDEGLHEDPARRGERQGAATRLAEAVLEQLPHTLQKFVRDCSPLTVMTADRCDALRGARDSAAALHELAFHHEVVVSRHADGWRLNPFLREHLQGELDRQDHTAPVRYDAGRATGEVGAPRHHCVHLDLDPQTLSALTRMAYGDLGGFTAEGGSWPTADPAPESTAGRLAVGLARAAVSGLSSHWVHGEAADIERLHREALEAGLLALASLAHAMGLLSTRLPASSALAMDVASQRRKVGDLWGAALVDGAVALSDLRAGRPDAVRLERLASDFRLLDCPLLESWCLSARALALATSGDSEGEGLASAAAAFARAAANPGAHALAIAALARAGHPEWARDRLHAAKGAARDAGMTCRPWTWLAPDPPARGPRSASRKRSRSAARPSGAADGAGVTLTPRRTSGPFEISCFGDFRMRRDGRDVDLTTVRPVARKVLRVLAVHAGRPVHREEIIQAIWTYTPFPAASHNLHVAVSALRRCLDPQRDPHDPGLLAREGEAYTLAVEMIAPTDLQRFDDALSRARDAWKAGRPDVREEALRSALEEYRDDVLPADGPAEWVAPVRERYRLMAAQAAGELAELELTSDAHWARDRAMQSLRWDPWRDATWRTLIEAHRRAGDVAAEARAQRDYEAVLASLGVGVTS